MDEFAVIDEFFKSIASNRSKLISQSIGDDAAIVMCPPEHELLISTDTLVENRHFLSDWPAEVIAYKSLATNVSDMAAMGAKPTWCSLALTLPELNAKWLSSFSKSFDGALQKFNMDLIGGDLTKGPLTITVTIHGISPAGKSIKRSGAQNKDIIYLTGHLGEPSYAVSQLEKVSYKSDIYKKLFYPEPKVNYSPFLQKYATSAIDISDGLSSDLIHILRASNKSAVIDENKLPLADSLKYIIPADEQLALMLNSGDEYELCFTIPNSKKEEFERVMVTEKLPFYEIGHIEKGAGLTLLTQSNNKIIIEPNGFKHF